MRSILQEVDRDRRSAARKNAALKVYLAGDLRSCKAKTRDISRRGLFIETRWLDFPLGTLVDLTFVQQRSEVIKLFRYTAIVVRYSVGGMGLRFCWTPYQKRVAEAPLN